MALVSSAAVAAGLISLVGLPWPVSLSTSLLLGTCALIVDTVVFGRPAPITSPPGRRLVQYLGVLAGLTALSLAFFVGQWSAQLSQPIRYQFIVANSVGYNTPIRSLPSDGADNGRVVSNGDTVYVDCGIRYTDATVWYRLSDAEGWLKKGEITPAPYTGHSDSPPECPK